MQHPRQAASSLPKQVVTQLRVVMPACSLRKAIRSPGVQVAYLSGEVYNVNCQMCNCTSYNMLCHLTTARTASTPASAPMYTHSCVDPDHDHVLKCVRKRHGQQSALRVSPMSLQRHCTYHMVSRANHSSWRLQTSKSCARSLACVRPGGRSFQIR